MSRWRSARSSGSLPWFHLVYGGGIYTVLRFADHLARQHGVESRFRVYDRDDERSARQVADAIAGAFPALADAPRERGGRARSAASDAAVATAWTSAFPLARHRGAPARFFFVQDFEPAFHPAGSASAVLEQAARLGLPGDRQHARAGRRLPRLRQPRGLLSPGGGRCPVPAR